jgi:hypothetical protein
VAEPQQLVPVTFGPTRTQRRYRLTTGLILVALSIFVFVHGAGAGTDVRGRVVGGVLFLLLGVLVLANRNAYTTIDRYGVRASSWPPIASYWQSARSSPSGPSEDAAP